MPNPWRRALTRPLPLAAVWLFLPLLAIAFGTLTIPTHPHDYWYALTLGRHIAATGRILRENGFLYTIPPDAPYRAQAWLADLALYRVFEAGGHRATALLSSGLLLVTWALIADRALRRSEAPRVVGLVTTLAIALCYASFNVRAQTFAFPLYAATLWITFGLADGALRFRSGLWLVPIAALWANLHASFPFVALFAASAGASLAVDAKRSGNPLRPIALCFGALTFATALAGIASPFGVENYSKFVRASQISGVSEWQAPKFSEPKGAATLAAFAVAVALLALRRKTLKLHEPVVLVATGALALAANRHDVWFAAALPLVVAARLAAYVERASAPPGRIASVVHGLALAFIFGCFIALQPGIGLERARLAWTRNVKSDGEGAGLLSRDQPLELVKRSAELVSPDRRIFHEQRLGGAIEYFFTAPGEPAPCAFVDQRMIVPENVWREYFALSNAKAWRESLERRHIGILLLEKTEQRALVDAVSKSDEWTKIGEQNDFVLLASRPK